MKNKIVVVGCGNVGMSYVFSLIHYNLSIEEIVLVDIDEKKASGEAMDLEDALVLGYPNKIRVGTYEDCSDARIVCITAGINQKKGQSRLDLIKENCTIFSSILFCVMKSGFKGIFLIATNPLDIMSYYTYFYTKVSPSRIIGSGTLLDTIRFSSILSKELDLDPKKVVVPVLGEHGDSSFFPFESAKIDGKNLLSFLGEQKIKEMISKVHNRAYDIIDKKGFTEYGVAMSLCILTKAIFLDEKIVLPVSTYFQKEDIFIGNLARIGQKGVIECIKNSFSFAEQKLWDFSVSQIKKGIQQIFE